MHPGQRTNLDGQGCDLFKTLRDESLRTICKPPQLKTVFSVFRCEKSRSPEPIRRTDITKVKSDRFAILADHRWARWTTFSAEMLTTREKLLRPTRICVPKANGFQLGLQSLERQALVKVSDRRFHVPKHRESNHDELQYNFGQII